MACALIGLPKGGQMAALSGNRGDGMVVVRIRNAVTEAAVEIVSEGPFAITYVNPADDPSRMK